MIFELVRDFADVLESMPSKHPRHRILKLLDEAILRDVHFIDRHPTTLFQCLWNTCWWFDCPEAKTHYVRPSSCQPLGSLPGESPVEVASRPLSTLLETWAGSTSDSKTQRPWLRSLRPPPVMLGAAQRSVIRGHAWSVQAVCFSPDSRKLASASSEETTIRLWDSATGGELRKLTGHEKEVESVCFSPDGRRIASGSWDKTVRIWDATTGAELHQLHGHKNPVHSVCFSPDGRWLVSSAGDDQIRVWEASTGIEGIRLQGPMTWSRCVRFSPDGRRVAAAMDDGTIRLWDAATGLEVKRFKSSWVGVNAIDFSPDGRQLVSTTDECGVIWEVEQGRELLRLQGQLGKVVWSPDGSRLACASVSHPFVILYDAKTGAELLRHIGHEGGLWDVAFSPNGYWLASAGGDGTIRIWDTDAEISPPTRNDHSHFISKIVFADDGRHLVTAAQSVRIWDGLRGHELMYIPGSKAAIRELSLSANSRWLALGTFDNAVRVWDLASGRLVVEDWKREGYVFDFSFSPDGTRLACAAWDNLLRVWHNDRWSNPSLYRGHTSWVRFVRFSPDGKRLASASDDHTIRLWDIIDHQPPWGGRLNPRCWLRRGSREVLRLSTGDARATAIDFSADGRLIAASLTDGSTRAWDTIDGRERLHLTGHSKEVARVCFSPDRRHLATASRGVLDAARVWDAIDGKCQGVFPGGTAAGLPAFVAGSPNFPYRTYCRGLETDVEESATSRVIAWFPSVPALGMTISPTGRSWAWSIDRYSFQISLETHASMPIPA